MRNYVAVRFRNYAIVLTPVVKLCRGTLVVVVRCWFVQINWHLASSNQNQRICCFWCKVVSNHVSQQSSLTSFFSMNIKIAIFV